MSIASALATASPWQDSDAGGRYDTEREHERSSAAVVAAAAAATAAASAAALPSALPEALRLDAGLWRLAHAETQADRQLARGLAALWDKELYRPLGHVRATDFVREHVGLKESRARWLARLGRRLEQVPDFDAELGAGRLSASHVIELGRIVDGNTPPPERAAWIERARGMSIRALRKLVRSEHRRREARDASDANGSGSAAAGDTGGLDAEIEVIDIRPHAERTNLGDPDADPDERPAGGWLSIPAPARVAVLWHSAVDVARSAAGRHLTLGQCAEMVFAEYLSAIGPDPDDAEIEAESTDRQRERLLAEVISALNNPQRVALVKPAPPAEDSAEHPTDPSTTIDWRIPDGELPADCVVGEVSDPWRLAETLARLSELKKKLRYELAARLERMHLESHWHLLGFASFERYCEERLAFGVRRAERLIRFYAGLRRFARVRQAYLSGRLSYTAVLLLVPILHRTTEAAWVEWADGITYRELERVVEYARTYSLPGAHPSVLESWVRGLEQQGLAAKVKAEEGATAFAAAGKAAEHPKDGATAFAASGQPVPLGYALPPSAPGALPSISGIPSDIALAPPELCLARIRFWLPTDALDLAHRALRHCRGSVRDPLGHTWVYFEIILVHFIRSLDTPQARAVARRHRIVARDQFRCRTPGCTSRANLQEHHLEPRAQGGSDDPSNQTALCAGHHLGGQHAGVIAMGGWAPDKLTTKLGINPRTQRALACYQNERRVSAEMADAALAAWRTSLRASHRTRIDHRELSHGLN